VEAEKVLSSGDFVYFSGGDVAAGMALLEARGLVSFLGRLHRQGKPFFGHSAGSILLAREWIRWRDSEDAASAERFPCLGLAPILCDTHGEEDGWEELEALLRLEPEGAVGYGLRSGSAVSVTPDGGVEILEGRVDRFVGTPSGIRSLGG
jgi:cyanophycinase-like exopeptidase